jgi:3-oxosteroid 1-dehydrogenase
MLSPRPLSRWIVGPYGRKLRRSTLPHIFTYHDMLANDLYRRPVRTALRLAPKILYRLLTSSAAKGTALTIGLLKGCLDHGCRIETEARAIELVVDETSRVIGVAVEHHGSRPRFIARRGVLLATGGFEWNAELLSRHFPGRVDRVGSPRSNEGDALIMAEAVGAQLARMDQALIVPCMPTLYEGRPHAVPVPFHMEPNAILVDRTARRFVNESLVDLGEALDRRDPRTGQPVHLPAWLISDSRFLRMVLRWYARRAGDWIVRRSSLEELAAAIDLSPDALIETVERFNALCATGRDEDFHRGETFFQRYKTAHRDVLKPIEKPPFIAIPFNRCVLSTKGGLRTNERGEVLRGDESAIEGLYCAGAAMANPIGTRAISAGTTIGPNMTWGYICARSMLSSNEGAEYAPAVAGHVPDSR